MMWIVLACGAVIGGALQTVCGFGAGVFMMMYLPYFFGMLGGPAVNAATITALSVALAIQFRAHFNWRITLLPLLVYLPVSTLVIHSVQKFDMDLLGFLFGVFLMALAAYYFLFAKTAVRATWKTAVVCSFISAVFGSLFGLGGPPMSLYYLDATDSKESYIANIQAVFAAACVSTTASRVACGIFTADLILPCVVGTVFICVGKWLGLKILDRIDAERMRRIVYLCVAVSGLITVIDYMPF